jgi:hypothetical protein
MSPPVDLSVSTRCVCVTNSARGCCSLPRSSRRSPRHLGPLLATVLRQWSNFDVSRTVQHSHSSSTAASSKSRLQDVLADIFVSMLPSHRSHTPYLPRANSTNYTLAQQIETLLDENISETVPIQDITLHVRHAVYWLQCVRSLPWN